MKITMQNGLVVAVLGLLVMGCSSTPSVQDASAPITFPASIQKANTAAAEALIALGFEVQKQEAEYVEGYLPRAVGVLVGSGGETVGIWLQSKGATRTNVRVQTARTFVGGAGQKDWEQDVLRELRKRLGNA